MGTLATAASAAATEAAGDAEKENKNINMPKFPRKKGWEPVLER